VSIDAKWLIDRALVILVDVSGDTYTRAEGLHYVNDAQRTVTMLRPDAKSGVETVKLVASQTKQTIPSTARRLMGITRNMGADGATPGNAVRGPVPQEDLDSFDPDWHQTAATVIQEYVYDERVPDIYYVYPGAHAMTQVWAELKLALFPVDLDDETDVIDLDEIYAPAMLEWVLYRYWSRDEEDNPNWARAARHFKNTFDLLQVKLRPDFAVSPRVLEFLK